ncbi:hypothetical protein CAPTEDRAFT_216921 [Capitella teleta]|uniref:Uncharacterized protein n=1 Tax=Capitella teleta TaxID=283909 RepID=R7VJE7_CAPTE|nr:hypothetical protein CAPTEDRAFT_216921 [Capitella teleta]|eukprot:ELU16481.1 hypothetical protein CAPTEDRAFT_216921 [Capitella teleta]
MKPEQERLMTVLKDTITLLCKNSLSFEKQLVIQGLICISVDKEDVLVVQVNDNVGESSHDPCLSCGHVSNPRPTIKPPDNRKRPRTPDPDSELPSPSKSSRSDDIDDDDSNLENDYKLLPIKKEEVIEDDDDDEDLVLIGEELAKHSTTPTLTGTSNQIYNHENSFNSNENSFISGFMQGTPSQINATASASQADNATAPEGWDQNLMQGSASGSEPAMTYSFLATPRRTTKHHPYSRKKMLPKEVLPESSSEVSAAPSSDSSPAAVELPTSTDSSLSAEDVELYSPSTPEPSSQESAEQADVQADEDPKILVFESSLQKLLNFCPDCGSPVVGQKKSYTGSMTTYVLQCHNGCTVRWNSQPKVDRQPLGNILIAAAILFTGLTFKRMSDWAAALKLKFISQTTFTLIQKSILWPVVGEAWRDEQKRAIREMKARRGAIMLGGDARCDSPGHNALYGSYTLMDIRPNAPNIIVSMELVHSSEVYVCICILGCPAYQ